MKSCRLNLLVAALIHPQKNHPLVKWYITWVYLPQKIICCFLKTNVAWQRRLFLNDHWVKGAILRHRTLICAKPRHRYWRVHSRVHSRVLVNDWLSWENNYRKCHYFINCTYVHPYDEQKALFCRPTIFSTHGGQRKRRMKVASISAWYIYSPW